MGVNLYLRTGKRKFSYVFGALIALAASNSLQILTYFIGNKGRKRAKSISELQMYYDDILVDLTVATEGDLILENPLGWWQRVGKLRYPLLYQIALDFLSIPATSCECERAFSRAKRTITMDRNRLSPDTIEALQLQRNWLLRKAIHSELFTIGDFIRRKTPSSPAVTTVTEPNSSFSIE